MVAGVLKTRRLLAVAGVCAVLEFRDIGVATAADEDAASSPPPPPPLPPPGGRVVAKGVESTTVSPMSSSLFFFYLQSGLCSTRARACVNTVSPLRCESPGDENWRRQYFVPPQQHFGINSRLACVRSACACFL